LFQRIVDRERFSEADAAKLMKKVLEALRHVHSKQVCHLDLKPENFVFADDTDESIRLIDFGGAKVFNSPDEDFEVCRGGTVFYTPPEGILSRYEYLN
jgi:serine/threonine protein kinase